MSRNFEHILKLELFHDYYRNGISQDFTCVPTKQCQRVIDRHQMIYRNTNNGFELLNQSTNNDINSVLALNKNTKLIFKLILKNNALLNITDLHRENGSILYFFNQKWKNVLNMKSIKLRPKLFKYKVNLSRDVPVELTVKDSFGNEIISKIVNGKSGTYETEINFESYRSGIYHFTLVNQDTIVQQEQICIDNQLFSEQPLGLIEIQKFTHQLVPKNYSYSFISKSVPWTFCLNQRKKNNDATYRIEQKEPSVSNNRYSEINFNFEEKTDDKKQTSIVFESGHFNKVGEFTAMPIPFYEEAVQLQLVQYEQEYDKPSKPSKPSKPKKPRDGHGHKQHHHDKPKPKHKGKVLIKKLAEPSIYNLKPEVFIYI
ncbi:MAG: hypothetical protein GQ574_19725 [Crocinitomix sp.]|nr:hypothetical protein [Crocinitomix sp.]